MVLNSLKRTFLALALVASLGITSKAMAVSISVNPNLATAGNSGEVIEIIGTGTTFTTTGPAARVYFGTVGVVANRGGNFKILDDTHILVTTPTQPKGSYAVTVTDAADGNAVALNPGISYTAANRTLQVSVIVNIAKNASIAWGIATDNDDTINNPKLGAGTHVAGTFLPYLWFVRDNSLAAPPAAASADLSATYSTDGGGLIFAADVDNAHSHTVQVASATGSLIEIDGIASDSFPAAPGTIFWTNNGAGGAGNPDKYQLKASLGSAFVISSESITGGNQANITTAVPHGLAVGDKVTITNTVGANITSFDGTFTILAAPAPTATTFSYTKVTGNVGPIANPGAMVESAFVVLNSTITAAVRAGGNATITTSAAHGLVVGDSVTIACNNAVFNGTFPVIAPVTANSFTYALAGAAANGVSGTVTKAKVAVSSATLTNAQTPVVKVYLGTAQNLGLELAVSTPTGTLDVALNQQTITVSLVATAQ